MVAGPFWWIFLHLFITKRLSKALQQNLRVAEMTLKPTTEKFRETVLMF